MTSSQQTGWKCSDLRFDLAGEDAGKVAHLWLSSPTKTGEHNPLPHNAFASVFLSSPSSP